MSAFASLMLNDAGRRLAIATRGETGFSCAERREAFAMRKLGRKHAKADAKAIANADAKARASRAKADAGASPIPLELSHRSLAAHARRTRPLLASKPIDGFGCAGHLAHSGAQQSCVVKESRPIAASVAWRALARAFGHLLWNGSRLPKIWHLLNSATLLPASTSRRAVHSRLKPWRGLVPLQGTSSLQRDCCRLPPHRTCGLGVHSAKAAVHRVGRPRRARATVRLGSPLSIASLGRCCPAPVHPACSMSRSFQ
jgi:hypothetical protein